MKKNEPTESTKYLLFIDLELDGFVIDIFDDKKHANQKMEELWDFVASLWNFTHDEITQKVDSLSQRHYKLTEKTRYETGSLVSQSNGIHTAGVIKINDSFTVDSYVKTREG